MANLSHNEPLFNFLSLARGGPGRDHFAPGEVAQISRTTRRAPEVMVKVLGRGGQDLKSVRDHLDYLRVREGGDVPIETDDGRHLDGRSAGKELLEDWDLDLDDLRPRSELDTHGGGSKKLVHKLMFSMPAGTPPDKVLTAVKNFAREEFALRHRYAMVLHTDEPHPHVHMVVKATSEHGERLHIRMNTLREWRQAFARHLRSLGVTANATDRSVRGVTEPRKLDGIYRPAHPKPGERPRFSTHMRRREEAVAAELRAGGLKAEPSKAKLLATRRSMELGWHAASEILLSQGQPELAADVRRFVSEMPPAVTEKGFLAMRLLEREREPRSREPPISR
jgi:hypothetical protein